MSSELWAIFSAAAWAVDSILVRKGTAFSNPSTAALVSFSVNAAVAGSLYFLSVPGGKDFSVGKRLFRS